MTRSHWLRAGRSAAIGLVAALGAATVASAQVGDGCRFYTGADFSGGFFGLESGEREPRLSVIGFDNDISSVELAPGCEATIWDDRNYSGEARVYGASAPRIRALNNRGSSVSCACDLAAPEPEPIRGACTLYRELRGGGRSLSMAPDTALDRLGDFDDRVQSATAAEGCELTLYSSRNGAGLSISLSGESINLPTFLRSSISSASCACGQQSDEDDFVGGGRGDPPRVDADGAACIAFARRSFRGRWRAFRDGGERDDIARFRNGFSSVRIADGCFAVINVDSDVSLYVDGDVENLPDALGDPIGLSCGCR